jgi:hypothetical protein
MQPTWKPHPELGELDRQERKSLPDMYLRSPNSVKNR